MLKNGLYVRTGQGHQAIVHNLRVQDGVVVAAWVYQVLGNYQEPGFEGQWLNRRVTSEMLTEYGYHRSTIAGEA